MSESESDSRKAVEVYQQALDKLLDAVNMYTELDYRMREALSKGVLDDAAQVDVGFLLREAEVQCDELRKVCKFRKEAVGKVIVMKVAKRVQQDPTLTGTLKGSLATGIPDIKMKPVMPKKGSEGYKALCRHFNISDEAIEAGLFQPHWNHFSEWLTDLAEKGTPPPPQVSSIRPEPAVSYRRRKLKRKEETEDE